MADTLTPETVEPLLQGRFGRPYLYRERCESSQRLLDPSLDEGAVAVCDEQTAGRGRLGRNWNAPPGTAILCSVLLRPPPERTVAELSLVGGVAVAETVEAATTLAAQIKWPNDVLINRRKVAGILAEATEGAVVLGVGLNVNQARERASRGREGRRRVAVDGRRGTPRAGPDPCRSPRPAGARVRPLAGRRP